MPRAGPAARSAAELDGIAKGQNRRTVLKDTDKIYLSKMNVMGNIINSSDFRGEALQLMSDTIPVRSKLSNVAKIIRTNYYYKVSLYVANIETP